MNSLKARLLIAATAVLVAFILFTGLALERAFRGSAEQAVRDKLQGVVYALLGVAEVAADGRLNIDASTLPPERLLLPNSGLYAAVLNPSGEQLWTSPSLLAMLPDIVLPAVGEWQFQQVKREFGQPLFVLAFGVRWALPDHKHRQYTFLAMEDTQGFTLQLRYFRATLLSWLIAAALMLLLAQLMVLRWGLSPLRKLARELRALEAGQKQQLEGHHQNELRPLVEALNALLRSERGRQARYRHALADLAHSLKTPLAVMRGLADRPAAPGDQVTRLAEQVQRMDQIVEYQLKRAAAAGSRAMVPPVKLKPLVDKVIRALGKVYHQKTIAYAARISAALEVRVDEADLMEVLGNLMDNASKCCRRCVQVEAAVDGEQLCLLVDDDGPGFPPAQREALLERGVRMDTRSEGQGIGLSVAAEIVGAYGGAIRLQDSPLGGARVAVLLPV